MLILELECEINDTIIRPLFLIASQHLYPLIYFLLSKSLITISVKKHVSMYHIPLFITCGGLFGSLHRLPTWCFYYSTPLILHLMLPLWLNHFITRLALATINCWWLHICSVVFLFRIVSMKKQMFSAVFLKIELAIHVLMWKCSLFCCCTCIIWVSQIWITFTQTTWCTGLLLMELCKSHSRFKLLSSQIRLSSLSKSFLKFSIIPACWATGFCTFSCYVIFIVDDDIPFIYWVLS